MRGRTGGSDQQAERYQRGPQTKQSKSISHHQPQSHFYLVIQFLYQEYIKNNKFLTFEYYNPAILVLQTVFPNNRKLPLLYIEKKYDYILYDNISLELIYFEKLYFNKRYVNDKSSTNNYIEYIFYDIKSILDNLYKDERFKKYMSAVRNIPIIKIDKYIEYLHSILSIGDNYADFIKNVYNNPFYSDLKDLFDKEFNYLKDANNFDLI